MTQNTNQTTHAWPNLFLIGAPRSGTSALHRHLAKHPDIFMTQDKEPHYWLGEGNYDFAGRAQNSPFWKSRPKTLEAYLSNFDQSKAYLIRGESSTHYLYSQTAAQTIKKNIPDAKILVLLRNPILRAFSNYNMIRSSLWGDVHDPAASFSKSIIMELSGQRQTWGWPYLHVEKGFYAKYLEYYYDHFNSSNIKIIISERLWNDPEVELEKIYTFLGVNPSIPLDQYIASNQSSQDIPRSIQLEKLCTQGSLRSTLLHFNKIMNRKKTILKRDDVLRLKDLYASDIQKLSKRVRVDLHKLWFEEVDSNLVKQ